MKIRRHARRVRHALENLDHVVGVGFGLKIANGKLTRRKCVTVFVDRKLPDAKLPRAQRIPARAVLGGRELPTDVISLGRFRVEARAHQIRSEGELGVTGCYAVKDEFLYGVSCAHVVGGKNGVVNQDEQVDAWTGNAWVPFGPAYLGLEGQGAGVPGDWGMIDAGLIGCDEPPPVNPLESFDDLADADVLAALPGTRVIGHSYVSGPLRARVSHVMIKAGTPAARVDVVITKPDLTGLTYQGDSGLLWTLEDGRALAIHIGGYRPDDKRRSTHAVGFFVRRLERIFELKLAASA